MTLKKLINVETFGCKLQLILSDKISKEVDRVYKKYNVNLHKDYEIEGIFISGEMTQYHLIIDLSFFSHNTIAHEVYHAVVRITEDRDVVDEETQAWLCGFLTEQIYLFAKKKKLEIK
jgi:hypothetical protein